MGKFLLESLSSSPSLSLRRGNRKTGKASKARRDDRERERSFSAAERKRRHGARRGREEGTRDSLKRRERGKEKKEKRKEARLGLRARA